MLSLTHEQLAAVFPFHVAVGKHLEIYSLGNSITKLDPTIKVGDCFADRFQLIRPDVQVHDFNDLARLHDLLVQLRFASQDVRLRGQFVMQDQGYAFLGSLWLSSPDQLATRGLSLRDFALHDPTADLLFMMQGRAAALRDSQELALKLRNKSDELRRAMHEARFASKAKSAFLANVSHEFRTPMTAILGFADMLYDELDDVRQKEYIDIMRRQAVHLLAIMDDVLDLSQIESGSFEVPRESVQVFELLTEIERAFTPQFKQKGIEFRIICHGSVPGEMQTNRSRLRQIIWNLLSNSLKFTDHGSVQMVVDLVSTTQPARLRIQVTDTGIGIDPRHAQHVFHPFTQVDETDTRRHGGTGLGLAIVKRLAAMLGGDVSFESQLGCGCHFEVTVECVPSAKATVAASSTPPTPTAVAPVTSKYPRLDCQILLVEDALMNQQLICRLLELAGARTIVANHGQEAVDLMLGPSPPNVELVVMDMQMPVMDGCQATRLLREAGLQLPIVALTANTLAASRDACLQAGCSDFLTKPIDRHKLFATLAEQLHRYRHPDPIESTREDLTLPVPPQVPLMPR